MQYRIKGFQTIRISGQLWLHLSQTFFCLSEQSAFSSNLIWVIHLSVLNTILFNEFQTSSFAGFGDEQPFLVILRCPSFAEVQVYLNFPRKHSFKHCFKKMLPQLSFICLSENRDLTRLVEVCAQRKWSFRQTINVKSQCFTKRKNKKNTLCRKSSVSQWEGRKKPNTSLLT